MGCRTSFRPHAARSDPRESPAAYELHGQSVRARRGLPNEMTDGPISVNGASTARDLAANRRRRHPRMGGKKLQKKIGLIRV